MQDSSHESFCALSAQNFIHQSFESCYCLHSVLENHNQYEQISKRSHTSGLLWVLTLPEFILCFWFLLFPSMISFAIFYRNDTTCVICRDEMFRAKKLPCGHIFHVECLLSWMQENDSCPTCTSSVVRHEKNSIIVQQCRIPSQSYRTG